MTTLSYYTNSFETSSSRTISMDILLDNIRDGQYQDAVLNYRNEKEKSRKTKLKKALPSVTISGTFSARNDNALLEHSGFICIDIDDIDPNDAKSLLCADEHVYAAFTSCGGYGLAVMFKITPSKHKQAFYGISEYLLSNYQIVIDPTCVNVSRLRYVSFDPDLYINEKAKLFTKYPPKKQVEYKPVKRIVFVKNDFEQIVNNIVDSRIDITYNYVDWLRIGFALSDKFGEGGRTYFHNISSVSEKYNQRICDKQYSACLRARGSGVTIATLYYFAKQAGIQTYSEETREIVKKVSAQKRGGMSDADIKDNFSKHSDFDQELVDEIVPQVQKETVIEDISFVELIENELFTRYDIRQNEISRYYELRRGDQWVEMKTPHFNTIYLTLKKEFEKVSFDLVERLIFSEKVEVYNPLKAFFEKHGDRKPKGTISKLSSSIKSSFGLSGDARELFIRKWLVGGVASIFGEHCAQFLVLSGAKKNTGKTEFFRRIVPSALKRYYSEDKLDKNDKDDDIKMTRKWIIMLDELEGKLLSNKERFKSLLSKKSFYLREPYGKNFVDLQRLAILGGTSNNYEIIPQDTGNRRIIPIQVESIDFEKFNSIDNIDIWMEAYHLYKSGYEYNFDNHVIEELNKHTSKFQSASVEEELIFTYFRQPINSTEGEIYNASDIITRIKEATGIIIKNRSIAPIMAALGLEKKSATRIAGRPRKQGYLLVQELAGYQKQEVESNPFL